VAGATYNSADHDLVFAARGPHGGVDLVVFVTDPERLPSLGRRLPHYGKYSWLVIPADGNRPVRDNWRPQAGPLHLSLTP
jgi:hypothetical protein